MTLKEIGERNRKRFRLMSKEAKIRINKEKLAAEDYKVVKCAELRLLNPELPLEEMPYDVAELIAKRNSLRDEINTLEAEVETA